MSNDMAPGWYSGKDGIESYWDGQRWTDGPEAKPAPPSGAGDTSGKKEAPKKKSDAGAGIAALVILVVVFVGFKACSSDSSKPNKYNVQGTCKDLVKNNLKNPTSAEFSSTEQTEYSASGMVTAENALGGKVTYSYRCSRSGDTVTLEGMTQR